MNTSKKQSYSILDDLINAIPVNIESLIRSAGIELDKNASQEKIRHGVNRSNIGNIGEIRKEGDSYKILVLGSDHYYRKRFTMAHELGHFMLHQNKIDKLGSIADNDSYRDSEHLDQMTQEEEREANAYAAKILMPEDVIKKVFADAKINHNGDEEVIIDEMSKMFQVSKHAMGLRLYLLDLIKNYKYN